MLENIDCLINMMSYLNVRERETCRQVCFNWLITANQMARTQQSLNIVGQRERNGTTNVSANVKNSFPRRYFSTEQEANRMWNPNQDYNSISNIIKWPYNFIQYQCFCQVFTRFPNLRSLRFECIDHWNDHLLIKLTKLCPHLKNISFVRCIGLGMCVQL